MLIFRNAFKTHRVKIELKNTQVLIVETHYNVYLRKSTPTFLNALASCVNPEQNGNV